MNKSSNPKPQVQSGCGFLAITTIVLVCMLLVNAWLVRTFGAKTLLAIDSRVFQAVQFVVPVLMVFVEFWIFDLVFTNRQLRRKTD